MFKNIADVAIGDIILESQGGRTTVTKIEKCQSSKGTKTHINNKDCYENFTDVRVQPSKNASPSDDYDL